MKVASWNVRGSNDPLKLQEIHDFLRVHNMDMLGVLETKTKKKVSGTVLRSYFGSYNFICNYDHLNQGRIWLLWKSSTVVVTPLIVHSQFIHCKVFHNASNQVFYISMIYASNDARVRDLLWDQMLSIKPTVDSWLVLGDFNVVRDVSERINKSSPNLSDILDFNSCLLKCELADLHSIGCEYTWTNKHDDDTIVWSKLDRAMANVKWFTQFPAASANFLPSGISDHSPVEAWAIPVSGSSTFKLFASLKNVKNALKSLHGDHFSGISAKVKGLKQELQDCQLLSQPNPLSKDLISKEKELMLLYCKYKRIETSIFQQKAKLNNIAHGDCSSKFFFAKIQERAQQQIIGQITDRNGQLQLGLPNGPCINSDDAADLTLPISTEEIRSALFDIGSDKSPGPDGFSSAFFKSS
ncbi:uncharacterized protein LOC141618613 [Silene latifolia]|uniref:uncharacterized protein LOC141618613 n=1 Tax=Silene latifolia TaxID=37657 RepID=UPI003D773F93